MLRSSRLKNKYGLTLLEVLVAMAILVTGIVFVLRSFFTALNVVRLNQNTVEAAYLAENRLWEIEQDVLAGINPVELKTDTINNKEYVSVGKISELAIPYSLQSLQLTVSWRDKTSREKRAVDFVTYLYKRI